MTDWSKRSEKWIKVEDSWIRVGAIDAITPDGYGGANVHLAGHEKHVHFASVGPDKIAERLGDKP